MAARLRLISDEFDLERQTAQTTRFKKGEDILLPLPGSTQAHTMTERGCDYKKLLSGCIHAFTDDERAQARRKIGLTELTGFNDTGNSLRQDAGQQLNDKLVEP